MNPTLLMYAATLSTLMRPKPAGRGTNKAKNRAKARTAKASRKRNRR